MDLTKKYINYSIKQEYNHILKTIPEKVATTRTEDGQKETAKTGIEVQTRRKTEHWTTEEGMEGPTSF